MTTTLTPTLELDADAQSLLFTDARTANTFTSDEVTDEQLAAIYDLVKFAPTSMNIQPLRLVAVRSADARARLVRHMSDGNKAKTAAAPLALIVAADVNFHDDLPRTFPHFPGARDLFTGDRDSRADVARFNTALQLGYLILGIRAAGLAAGPMTGFDAAGVNAEFFADGEHEVVAVVNVGKPGEGAWQQRLPRLEYDETVTTV